MKRLSRSDSPAALMSICTSTEEQNIVYNRELQSMMEGYDEEEACMVMEEGCGQKKRRLSVDQVKALEKSFDVENKLEPDRKQRLAQELGLQPRQVAVWFQNRRARWKTKQLERDYSVLKANYDSLKLNLESLQTDNESLINEIRKLRSKLNEDEPEAMNADVKERLGFESDKPEPEFPITAAITPEAPPMEGFEALKQSDAGPSDSDSSAILNSDELPKTAAAGVAETSAAAMLDHSHDYGNGGGFEFLSLSETGYNGHIFQVKMEEHNFLSEETPCCAFFSEVEQAPMLHWYTSENWPSNIQLE
ncbi:hypothetical protein V2J09_021723 [Rumex salicifolius]